jgi:hypothetical protein
LFTDGHSANTSLRETMALCMHRLVWYSSGSQAASSQAACLGGLRQPMSSAGLSQAAWLGKTKWKTEQRFVLGQFGPLCVCSCMHCYDSVLRKHHTLHVHVDHWLLHNIYRCNFDTVTLIMMERFQCPLQCRNNVQDCRWCNTW